ncbi:MAG: transcription termination factor NusA [Bacilli bacterium]|nr:transcription termination factor NusA [Bacilli bacterium]
MAINVVEFNAALEQLEITKGISRETVLAALKEAMIKGFKKEIGDDEAIVEVNIDLDRGTIEMFQIKTVVEDAEDILLEISLEDANKDGGKYKIGDEYRIPASPENLRKAIVLSIKSILKQKFAEAEKEILFEQFRDKIGTMITGRVEQFDDRGASVNIGKTSVYMQKKDMIKGERFAVGDTIKLFVVDVESNTKGARIHVSRSHEGFLKALMTEEIHDIYDGTIVIKAIAREAGERSKVAVYCEDPTIDPAGTCIGPNGSRIQKVVSQLGNGPTKEKIDIISYSSNTPLFIMEALKPAQVSGIKIDEESKSAVVIVKDDSFSLAIGKKGVNVRLAVKLTGYNIDIKTESDAVEEEIEYTSFDEISAMELEEKAARIAQAQRESLVYQDNRGSLPGLPEGYVAPQERTYEEEANDFDSALEEQAEREEAAPQVNEEPVQEEAEAEVEETTVEAEAEQAQEEPAEEEAQEEAVEVKTTTTLEDLEKSLESSAKKETKGKGKKTKKKAEEETSENVVVHEGPRMSIYTEEELREMEEEEEEYDEVDDEDIDYDEYDQYYDEN